MGISFSQYGEYLGGFKTNGRVRKHIADQIMDATFTQDIQYQVGYFFDYYHSMPENRLLLEGFDPESDPYVTPIDLKFVAHTKQTYDKDEISFHLQFRPGQEHSVNYYDEVFGKRYNADFPVGLYCWLRDADDVYRRWLVVGTADRYGNQFPMWEVLRCTDVFRWIKDGKYYQFPGVSRSQNSYNSGLWTDYKFTQPEDQAKFALPLNRDTEHLYYNTSLVLDANVLTEPRVWKISKINRTNSKGIAVFTCAQEQANTHTLKADYDEDGNVIVWWADWEERVIEPVEAIPNVEPTEDDYSPTPSVISEITCSGKAQVKVGGSTKTLTVKFTDSDRDPIEFQPGEWNFKIGDEDVTSLINLTDVSEGKVKVKFLGGDEYLNKILTAIYTSSDAVASLNLEIIAL